MERDISQISTEPKLLPVSKNENALLLQNISNLACVDVNFKHKS